MKWLIQFLQALGFDKPVTRCEACGWEGKEIAAHSIYACRADPTNRW
jgi:hypothetical protein